MIDIGIVKDFGKLIKEAESRIIEGIKDGRIETEPSITDRFLEQIEIAFESYNNKNNHIRFFARTLRDRGVNASEKRYGADFCGVLDIKLPNFKLQKGFLTQAKLESYWASSQIELAGARVVFSVNKEFNRLKNQANKMLAISPDSFVIIYSVKGFVVVPASSVQGLQKGGKIYGKTIDRFFKEYLMCFIGDPRIKAWDDESLEKIMKETKSETAIMFQVISDKNEI